MLDVFFLSLGVLLAPENLCPLKIFILWRDLQVFDIYVFPLCDPNYMEILRW